jgi:Ca2+-binding RTX toxin-like protein
MSEYTNNLESGGESGGDTSKYTLPVQTGVTALKMANQIFGEGVTVVSATFQGDIRSAGLYTKGDTICPDYSPADTGVILSTGLASSFTSGSSTFNKSTSTSTDTAGVDNNTLMNSVAGVRTYDGAILTTQFTSTKDEMTIQFTLSSEEYMEWVGTGHNDAVGIWINGQRAQLTLGDGKIAINNFNTTTNPNLFLNNASGNFNSEMDGSTVTLTLKVKVNVGVANTLVIGVADAGDTKADTSLMIVADSVQSALVAHDDLLTLTAKGHGLVDLLANDMTVDRREVHISELNGHKVVAGDHIVLGTGETLTLNADGTISVDGTTHTAPVTFTYQITDKSGVTDTAYVTLSADPVDGTAGDDLMDTHFVDAQGNQIDGSDGASEVIMGYAGNDKITAGLGHDDIYGGTGNDFIRAGDGNDLIYGGDGNDVLDGGTGEDRMDGGAGNDIFYIDNTKDVVIEAANGGYDKIISTLSHTLSASFEELWLKEGSAAHDGIGNALANKIIGNAVDNLIRGDAGYDQLWGEGGNDDVYGGLGNDLLFGGDGADKLYGDEGADKLYGGSGADSLYGGIGADSLEAGQDGDVLYGEAGNDLMKGGAGNDHFVFATGSGVDRVKEFVLGSDQIVIDGVDVAKVSISHHGTNLWVQWDSSDRIILNHIDPHAVVTTATLGIGFGWDHFG